MAIYKKYDSHKRAKSLFLSSLTEEQKKQFLEEGRISVKGSNGGEYILPWGIHGWGETYVERVDDPNKIMCYTVYGIPYYDVILAQKLLIETREDIFLKGCNCWRLDKEDIDNPGNTTMWDYLGNGYGEKKRDTA